ncbi:cupredoxin domain-containing protein [Cesiribacter andamanensis]|uniref:hypothetical protein n=1 Tax=Cesiribacter andamanensis TaxID=649507 RepID=UPI00126976A1|nr:hypothetical protein [Cesiribacter andamanensis]
MSRIPALFLSCCLLLAFGCSDSQDAVEPTLDMDSKANNKSANMMKEYWVEINPLNHSGVTGQAKLVVEGNVLTVEVWAEGLEAGMPHPQHIHGFVENKGNATCPPPSADVNGDGLIDLGEGVPFYGPVLVSLTPFPTAEDGTIHYKQTFMLGMGDMIAYQALKPLQNRVIVLHGMTVEGTYWPTLPIACGQIMPGNSMGMGNR